MNHEISESRQLATIGESILPVLPAAVPAIEGYARPPALKVPVAGQPAASQPVAGQVVTFREGEAAPETAAAGSRGGGGGATTVVSVAGAAGDDLPRAVLGALRTACRALMELFPAGYLDGGAPPIELLVPGMRRNRGPAVRLEVTDLLRPTHELLAVLLHGLVHYANALAGIRDCNVGHYHNQKFRELASAVGLEVCRQSVRFGWADTRPSAALAQRLRQLTGETSGAADFGLDPAILATAARQLGGLPSGKGSLPGPGPRRWNCGLNLPGEGHMAAWRLRQAPIPGVPRYRVALIHGPIPYERYPKVPSVREAAQLLWRILSGRDRESLAVLFLDSRQRLIGYDVPYVGVQKQAMVEPRGILIPALMVNASCIFVGHNHPSGDPDPSRQDRLFSDRLREAGDVVGIRLIASLTVGGATRWRVVT